MFRINGVGLGFDGVSKPDHEDNCTATQWFMFLFVPIFPIARYKVKPIRKVPFCFEFQVLAKQKLILSEVLATYLFGWILFPALVFVPFFTAAFLGSVSTNWTQIPLILLAIAWLIVSVWKLRTWDYERWFKR